MSSRRALALALASIAIVAACRGRSTPRDRDDRPAASAAAAAPALPPSDEPPAPVVRAKVKSTEVVHLDPSPELQAAADDYAAAKVQLDEAQAAAPLEAPTSCAELRRKRDLHATAAPVPRDFPPTPESVELCGWAPGDRPNTIELAYVTTAEASRVHRYYQDALLARGHTIEPWDPEATGTTAKAFDFGNTDWGGSVFVSRDGYVTITVETYPRSARR